MGNCSTHTRRSFIAVAALSHQFQVAHIWALETAFYSWMTFLFVHWKEPGGSDANTWMSLLRIPTERSSGHWTRQFWWEAGQFQLHGCSTETHASRFSFVQQRDINHRSPNAKKRVAINIARECWFCAIPRPKQRQRSSVHLKLVSFRCSFCDTVARSVMKSIVNGSQLGLIELKSDCFQLGGVYFRTCPKKSTEFGVSSKPLSICKKINCWQPGY